MSKRTLLTVLLYLLFVVIVGVPFFFAINAVLGKRDLDYFQSNVLALYATPHKQKQYLQTYAKLFGYATENTPVLELSTENPEHSSIKLLVLKAYNRKTKQNALLVYVSELLAYSGNPNNYIADVANKSRTHPQNYKSEVLYRLEFSFTNPNFKFEQKNKFSDFLKPFIITTDFVTSNGKFDNYIDGIKITPTYAPSTFPNKKVKKPELIVATKDSKFAKEEPAYPDAKRVLAVESKLFDRAYLTKPFNKSDMADVKINYSGLNRGLVLVSLAGSGLILVLTYFSFVHKPLKVYLKERRRAAHRRELEQSAVETETRFFGKTADKVEQDKD